MKRFFSQILFLVTCIFIVVNCIVVAITLQSSINQDFKTQLKILSYESSQLITSNYSVVENVVDNIIANNKGDLVSVFREATKKIDQYASVSIVLANSNHDTIATTRGTTYNCTKACNIENRGFTKNMLAAHDELHIGHLLYNAKTRKWLVPIVKGIFIDNKYLGSIILGVPLIQFSESLIRSNITIKSVTYGTDKHASFYYPEADTNIYEDKMSFFDILQTSFFDKKDFVKVSKTYKPTHYISENITFIMSTAYIQKLFWTQFGTNFCIFCFFTICMIFITSFITQKLSHKLEAIEKKLLNSASRLHNLVPGYNNSSYFPEYSGAYNKIIHNVERYVDSNALVIDALEKQHNTILEKDKKLNILQKHFSYCLAALKEEGLYFIEGIEDIRSNSDLCKDRTQLLSIFEKIYGYSKSHKEYLASLQDSISSTQKILLTPRNKVNIEDILKSKFVNRYNNLNTNNQQKPRMFFAEALEAAIDNILNIASKDSCTINLSEQDDATSIEIRFDLDKNNIDTLQIQQSLEKARLFALLDDGFVGLYQSDDVLIVTIVYGCNIGSADSTREMIESR